MAASSASNFMTGVNLLVAGGSPDGMAAVAACLRNSEGQDIRVIFTRPFEVNKIDFSSWPSKSKVGFVNLGVNNEGTPPNPQLTVDFVNKIYKLGHEILFIADEHGKKAWEEVLITCGHSITELRIQPEDRGEEFPSCCAIIKKAFGESVDEHTRDLLHAGNEADLMNYETHFGRILNEAIKSNLRDSNRRLHLVRWLAFNKEPDATIERWMKEYEAIKANSISILGTRQDLGFGMSIYDGTLASRHDATFVFNNAYKTSSIVVLKCSSGASIGTKMTHLNILEILQHALIPASGMPSKANFDIRYLTVAIQAIWISLYKQIQTL